MRRSYRRDRRWCFSKRPRTSGRAWCMMDRTTRLVRKTSWPSRHDRTRGDRHTDGARRPCNPTTRRACGRFTTRSGTATGSCRATMGRTCCSSTGISSTTSPRNRSTCCASAGCGRARPSASSARPTIYVSSRANDMAAVADPERRGMIEALQRDTAESRITLFGMDDPRRGIVHVIGPRAGPEPAGHDHRLRRQPYFHARRAGRAGLRHRRDRGDPRARHAMPAGSANRAICA